MKASEVPLKKLVAFLVLFMVLIVLSLPDVSSQVVSFCYDQRNAIYTVYGAVILALSIFRAIALVQSLGKHIIAPSGTDLLGPFQRLGFQALSMFFSFSGAVTVLMLSFLGRMPSEIGTWGLAFINLAMIGLIGWNSVKLVEWFNTLVIGRTAEVIEKDEVPLTSRNSGAETAKQN